MSLRTIDGVTYRYRFITDERDKKRCSYSMRARMQRYPGMEAWRFALVPVRISATIKKNFGHSARGWGSLRVQATVGATTWKSSIFPDKKAGAYILPLKAAVREAEGIRDGQMIALHLEIL